MLPQLDAASDRRQSFLRLHSLLLKSHGSPVVHRPWVWNLEQCPPNLSGSRNQLHGKTFFHRLVRGGSGPVGYSWWGLKLPFAPLHPPHGSRAALGSHCTHQDQHSTASSPAWVSPPAVARLHRFFVPTWDLAVVLEGWMTWATRLVVLGSRVKIWAYSPNSNTGAAPATHRAEGLWLSNNLRANSVCVVSYKVMDQREQS